MAQKDKVSVKEAGNLIRTAWKARKKQIGMDGLMYNLSLSTKKVTYTADGQLKVRKESWLIARRDDGALTPVYSVELKYMGNLRSSNLS